jgi:hypothetical protein
MGRAFAKRFGNVGLLLEAAVRANLFSDDSSPARRPPTLNLQTFCTLRLNLLRLLCIKRLQENIPDRGQ